MSSQENGSQSLGESLLAAGWCQGSLFSAPSACFVYNVVPKPGVDRPIAVRPAKRSEKLVLITQTCDIVANTASEPFVEALICRVEKDRQFLANIDRNSARWFVVDPQAGLVAFAKYRVQMSKELLSKLKPEPWSSSPLRFSRFIRWLARRYDRPALPDTLVDAFQQPVAIALAHLSQENPNVVAAFNHAIREVRVSVPPSEVPPFELHVVFLTRRGELTQEEADAIQAAEEVIRASVDSDLVHLGPDVYIVDDEGISLAEYLATRPLFLEYLTFAGEEAIGAEPYPRG